MGHQQNLPQCALHPVFLSNLPPQSYPLWINLSIQPPSTLQSNLHRTGRALSVLLPFSNIFNVSIRKNLYKRKLRGQVIKYKGGSLDTLTLILELLNLCLQKG